MAFDFRIVQLLPNIIGTDAGLLKLFAQVGALVLQLLAALAMLATLAFCLGKQTSRKIQCLRIILALLVNLAQLDLDLLQSRTGLFTACLGARLRFSQLTATIVQFDDFITLRGLLLL